MKITQNRIAEVKLTLRQTPDTLLLEFARLLLAYADEEVPVLTGYLRSTGDLERIAQGYAVFYLAAYAVYVHNGTSRQAANPFLYRALIRAADAWVQVIQKLKQEVEG